MAPASSRGGEAEEIRFAVVPSSYGAVLVALSAKGVAAILLGDNEEALMGALRARFGAARIIGGDASDLEFAARIVAFIEAPALGLDLKLDIRGTAFQQSVWQALREIPPGRTMSYSDIAARIGAPNSVRAVAGACAQNVHAVAIPCHRVLRSNGDLSGYRWGVARKRALLDSERTVRLH
jgi:AraC family transcriptional regulator of adaptative response/methylated-DNA-[protein]-cysteine methyltransferase